MIVSCNDCDWGVCISSEEEAPSVCPSCGSENLVCEADTAVPESARGDDGAAAVVHQDTIFPTSYPAPESFDRRADAMTAPECLIELADMGVDFDWIRRPPIPDAIVLPEPVWICGILLKYNANCRPERDWQPPTAPSGARAAFDVNAGPQDRGRRGRTIDAKAALALARFFHYLAQLNVKQVDHAGIFPGRGDIAHPTANNPHVWGKAIDLCWFYISNNGRNEVAGFRGVAMASAQRGVNSPDWGILLEVPRTPRERFLRQMDTELRRHWRLVLTPDDTANHRGQGNHTTHFHIDVHEYRSY